MKNVFGLDDLTGLEVTEESPGDDRLYTAWWAASMKGVAHASFELELQPLPAKVPDAWASPSPRVAEASGARRPKARVFGLE